MKNLNTGYRYYWNKKEQAYIQHEEYSTLSSREIMTLHPGQVSRLLWSTPPLHLCLSVSLGLRSKQTTLLKLPYQLPGRRMEESKRGETNDWFLAASQVVLEAAAPGNGPLVDLSSVTSCHAAERVHSSSSSQAGCTSSSRCASGSQTSTGPRSSSLISR